MLHFGIRLTPRGSTSDCLRALGFSRDETEDLDGSDLEPTGWGVRLNGGRTGVTSDGAVVTASGRASAPEDGPMRSVEDEDVRRVCGYTDGSLFFEDTWPTHIICDCCGGDSGTQALGLEGTREYRGL
ncbi:hypothetical protein [Streptomyces cadmiisoli]|uniref:hypothetical protein n=1 Tax=Streptomyces cadmiisoli TaxID=2184053 RepID=UPI003D709372